MAGDRSSLQRLARRHGLQTAYVNGMGQRRVVPPDTILVILRALGVPIEHMAEAGQALALDEEAPARILEPVVVAWGGAATHIAVRVPPRLDNAQLRCHLVLEDGNERQWAADIEREGIVLPELPPGYHHLTVEVAGRESRCLLISAPVKAYRPEASRTSRKWGVFLPLYALYSRQSGEIGDFTDLQALAKWMDDLGGDFVATLPLFATFLGDGPHDPSPYSPVSRRFWNELYLDVDALPEIGRCPDAAELLASPAYQRELAALQAGRELDYRRLYSLKRGLLERLSRRFFDGPGDRDALFREFLASNPAVEDYARFCAVCERRGEAWQAWPEPMRDGELRDGDYDGDAFRYHLYVQWRAHEQMGRATTSTRARLYLDLPVGVHSAGYDQWRERHAFAEGVTCGAPPDTFFTAGQDWGFAPPHPDGDRERGYPYFIDCVRGSLYHAGILRIDHIMGLHRLFWIPEGAPASEGAYMRYRAEELYAILCLESHRAKAMVVGEDLGTVPLSVRHAMRRHGILRSHVLQFELPRSAGKRVADAPRDSVASFGTHDLPTFTAIWNGLDIDDLEGQGHISAKQATKDRRGRGAMRRALLAFLHTEGLLTEEDDDAAVLRACLAFLARGKAELEMVNLEDLWLEQEPQNRPGTGPERPNWRRRARYSMEEFCQMPSVLSTLELINRLRRELEKVHDGGA